MKKINIAKILVKGLFMITPLLMVSCGEEEVVEYNSNNPTYNELPESYLQIVSGFFPFEVDDAFEYPFQLNIINGRNAFTEVRMYKSFTDAGTGNTVEDVLAATLTPTTSYGRTVVEKVFTYSDLANGVSILPASSVDVTPGSGWSFRFEATTSEGEVVDVPGAINIIYSKWAGNYEVIDSKYCRRTSIDEDFGGWDGTVVFIGYVDATTLSYNDRWGYFSWAGSSFNFEFDETTLEVTDVPVIVNGLFSGDRELKCGADDSRFELLNNQLGFVACDNGNFILEDAVNGNHQITLVYGYLASTGPRQFWEVLEKL